MKQGASTSSSVRELASGVDAIYMSARGTLAESLLQDLEGHRKAAVEARTAIPLVLDGETFGVAGSGMGRYRFRLEHEYGAIAVTDSPALPTLRIQPRAEFLHAQGPRAATAWFSDLAAELVGARRVTASRMDLFSDWQGWTVDSGSRHRMVTRARYVTVREERQEFTGFELGRRATGTLSARVYDKVRDIRHKGTDWWFGVWGDRFDPDEKVFRLEFEFGRAGLQQFEIDTVDESLDAAGSLWTYATEKWLTMREPTRDETSSRWPLDPDWEAIQSSRIVGGALGLDRVRNGARAGSLRRMMPALNGYLAQFGALMGCSGVEDTVAALPGALRRYEEVSPISFAGRITRRRQAFGRAR